MRKKIGDISTRYIVCDDINYCDIDWQSNNTSQYKDRREHKFLEAVKDSYLEQHVEEATHVVKHKQPSLLDLLLTDKSSEHLKTDHTRPLGHADHASLQATFNIWTKC